MRTLLLGMTLVAMGCSTGIESEGQVDISGAMTVGILPIGPEFFVDPSPLVSGSTSDVYISGAAPNAWVALVGSVAVFGPPACFSGLGGTCADFAGPGFIVDIGRADVFGNVVLQASPPSGYPSSDVSLQVLTYKAGVVDRSEVSVETLYNDCALPLAADPAYNATGVYAYDDIGVFFEGPTAALNDYAVFANGAQLDASVDIVAPDMVTIVPDSPLPGNTVISVGVRTPCGDVGFTKFTTANDFSFNPDDIVGNAYQLDVSSVVIHEPAELQDYVDLLTPLADVYAGFVGEHDSGAGLAFAVGAMLRDNGTGGLEQDTCRPTDLDLGVSTDDNPGWSRTFPTIGAGEDVSVEIEVHDAGASVSGHGTGYVIALDVVRALGLGNDEDILCDGLVDLGADGCVPCPVSTGYACVYVEASATAVLSSVELDYVSEVDAVAECGTVTPWY